MMLGSPNTEQTLLGSFASSFRTVIIGVLSVSPEGSKVLHALSIAGNIHNLLNLCQGLNHITAVQWENLLLSPAGGCPPCRLQVQKKQKKLMTRINEHNSHNNLTALVI